MCPRPPLAPPVKVIFYDPPSSKKIYDPPLAPKSLLTYGIKAEYSRVMIQIPSNDKTRQRFILGVPSIRSSSTLCSPM